MIHSLLVWEMVPSEVRNSSTFFLVVSLLAWRASNFLFLAWILENSAQAENTRLARFRSRYFRAR